MTEEENNLFNDMRKTLNIYSFQLKEYDRRNYSLETELRETTTEVTKALAKIEDLELAIENMGNIDDKYLESIAAIHKLLDESEKNKLSIKLLKQTLIKEGILFPTAQSYIDRDEEERKNNFEDIMFAPWFSSDEFALFLQFNRDDLA